MFVKIKYKNKQVLTNTKMIVKESLSKCQFALCGLAAWTCALNLDVYDVFEQIRKVLRTIPCVGLKQKPPSPFARFLPPCVVRGASGKGLRLDKKKRGLMPPQIARCGQRPLASQTVMTDDMRFKPRDQSTSICTNLNSLIDHFKIGILLQASLSAHAVRHS